MITIEDYWMGRDTEYPPSDDLKSNAIDTVNKLCQLEVAYGQPLTITSGYRSPEINAATPGAKAGDAHETCRGADLRDPSGALSNWLVNNIDILESIGFWMEAPSSAINHVHVQTYAPHSGNRIFIA